MLPSSHPTEQDVQDSCPLNAFAAADLSRVGRMLPGAWQLGSGSNHLKE